MWRVGLLHVAVRRAPRHRTNSSPSGSTRSGHCICRNDHRLYYAVSLYLGPPSCHTAYEHKRSAEILASFFHAAPAGALACYSSCSLAPLVDWLNMPHCTRPALPCQKNSLSGADKPHHRTTGDRWRHIHRNIDSGYFAGCVLGFSLAQVVQAPAMDVGDDVNVVQDLIDDIQDYLGIGSGRDRL
jgi:hypothetical protein